MPNSKWRRVLEQAKFITSLYCIYQIFYYITVYYIILYQYTTYNLYYTVLLPLLRWFRGLAKI